MDSAAPFHLEQALDRYLHELNRQRCLRRDDLAELKSHLLDQIDDWQALGLSSEEAWHTALLQMGDVSMLQGEYRKINRWYSRGQSMLATGKEIVTSKRILAFGVLFFVLTFSSMFTGRAADQRKPSTPPAVHPDTVIAQPHRSSQPLRP